MDYTKLSKDDLEKEERRLRDLAEPIYASFREDKRRIREEFKQRIAERTATYINDRSLFNTQLNLIDQEWKNRKELAASAKTAEPQRKKHKQASQGPTGEQQPPPDVCVNPEPQIGTQSTQAATAGGGSTITGVTSVAIGGGPGPSVSTINLSQMEPHMRKRSASVDSDSGGSPWTFEKGTGLSPPSPQEGKILDELPPPKCLSPLTRHHLLKKPNPRTTIIPRLPSH
ncbi:uncharacterized protein LOC110861883 isoform X1 [Folsomia candida]|nr:uncharacterized protein LOC110861883 isoform X1 [Folsomia candida]